MAVMHRLKTIALTAAAGGCLAAGAALAGPLLSAGAVSSPTPSATDAPAAIPVATHRHPCPHERDQGGDSSGTSQASPSDV
jgi:hypothetical protein